MLGQRGPREEDVLLPQKIVGRDERHYVEHGLNVGHAPKERRPRELESHLTYISLAFAPLSLLNLNLLNTVDIFPTWLSLHIV